VKGLRFGWPANLWSAGVDPEIVAGLEDAATWLERAGAAVVPFEFMPGEFAVATYYLVATAEASSNLARFDGVRYGFRHPDSGDVRALYTRTRSAGFGPEVQRASCSAPTPSRPATTTPITSPPSARAPASGANTRRPSRAATSCCCRPPRRCRSGWGRRPRIHWRCT
jgi:hypothetical protein